MKKIKRILTLSLVLVLALSLMAPAANARYSHITSISATLDITSAGKSTSYGYVKLSDSTDTCDMTLSLQQKNGSTWSTIKSWETSGSRTVALEKDWYVLNGTYRSAVTVDVYNSSGTLVETETVYSSSVTY